MKIRILPLLQMILLGVLMLAIKIQQPFADFNLYAPDLISTLIALCGIALVLAGGALFRKHQTTFNPHDPDKASVLVKTGIYCYTRNPMYLGFLCILTAWAIFLGNLLNLLVLPLYIYTLTLFNIRPEEQALASKFGEQYESYRRRVRRWL